MKYRIGMGHWKFILLSTLMLSATAGAEELSGSNGYENNWYKVAAGGSTIPMTGGDFGVAGTIGQWDTASPAAIVGGNYTVVSGYWAAAVEPLPDQMFRDRFESNSGALETREPLNLVVSTWNP